MGFDNREHTDDFARQSHIIVSKLFYLLCFRIALADKVIETSLLFDHMRLICCDFAYLGKKIDLNYEHHWKLAGIKDKFEGY